MLEMSKGFWDLIFNDLRMVFEDLDAASKDIKSKPKEAIEKKIKGCINLVIIEKNIKEKINAMIRLGE